MLPEKGHKRSFRILGEQGSGWFSRRHRHKLQLESSLLLRTPPARALLGREQGPPGRSRDGYPQIAQRLGACAHPRCSLAGVFRRLLGVPSTSGLVDWHYWGVDLPVSTSGACPRKGRVAWPAGAETKQFESTRPVQPRAPSPSSSPSPIPPPKGTLLRRLRRGSRRVRAPADSTAAQPSALEHQKCIKTAKVLPLRHASNP